MSVARARRVNTSRPWTVLRFTTRLRLPRFTALKLGLSAATPPGICLDESPAGGSTLTTSAPRSARIIAQNGPAITCVTSSTRNPASAFCSGAATFRLYCEGGVIVHRAHDVRSGRPGGDLHIQSAAGSQRDDFGD